MRAEYAFQEKDCIYGGMNETLCSFDEIPWFSCCGVSYDKPSYYPYLQEKDPKRAEKLLLHTKNYSGTVCLTNLFKKAFVVQIPLFCKRLGGSFTRMNSCHVWRPVGALMKKEH